MTVYNIWTTPVDYSFSLDLFGLVADDYNADSYTDVNSYVSIKSASDYIDADCVKLTKSNRAKIKFVAPADGTISVSLTGSVIMPTYESRKGSEEVIASDTPISVSEGTTYYIQGSASSAAKVTKIEFVHSFDEE